MKDVAIIGGSGYTGSELLRLLIPHKGVEIIKVTSRENEGKKVDEVHNNLKGLTDLRFSNEDDMIDVAEDADLFFFALPHTVSMEKVPFVFEKTKLIDLSADYRFKNLNQYERYYKEHVSAELNDDFIYGMPEYNRKSIKNADHVANPGCFPTASILSICPLVEEDLTSGKVIIDAKTGSSGSGAKPSISTHHPERSQDLYAYKILEHQHQPEIEQELKNIGGKEIPLTFITHSAPFTRGIYATVYLELKEEISHHELISTYQNRYEDEFFVRMVDHSRISVVKGTNFCDISVKKSKNELVVTSAIDNLVKGASGNAVQNMNLMLNFDEKEGLESTGFHP